MTTVVKQNLLDAHNRHRVNYHGRRSLALHSTLQAGAQKMSDQMAKYQWRPSQFGANHRRPNGTSFYTWWDNTYKGTRFYYNWGAENLGWDHTTSAAVFGPQTSHGGTGNQWTTSTAHHGFLISAYAHYVGFGVSIDSRGRYYWVAHFGEG